MLSKCLQLKENMSVNDEKGIFFYVYINYDAIMVSLTGADEQRLLKTLHICELRIMLILSFSGLG
jgi:hypothetical protein